ncbi:hypothetical protein C5748_16990 [Phyllobacterium phragmitis]|uniref:Uncharacterized protein n=1 Tax=Phyllobacterium phragmitis TaxID=2670329 RepID=A0A2S9INU3_9HYPH|nr:hypothetical protein [Phyllobacterium phragmitis]PRD42162.1 hypothetical protein C5748_16990 [Phyllobacterium phragmitis]
MSAKLSAMAAMFAFMSSILANAKLYELTGDGWHLVIVVAGLVGAVGSAAALAIQKLGVISMTAKLLALAAFIAAICIASMAQAAVPHPDRPITLSAERPLTLQPIPIRVKTKRCYSQVYLFGDDVLTVVRCED